MARRNPLAKLAAAALLGFGLLFTLDPLTPVLALAVDLAAAPLFGVRPVRLARRYWPLLLSAAGIAGGQLLFTDAGPVRALGLGLRVLAVALPGIISFGTTDPTDLADALVQNAKAPARFAIGALAAFRLMPLLGEEWRTLRQARRARGVDAGRNPIAMVALAASLSFGLLVGAIRRGIRLATAMDARGFDSGRPRTSARPSRFTRADAALIAAAALAVALILTISITAGAYRPVFT
ncbi:energy-coupling factor transporter transmembrane component T family protein [Rugosimonospora acidiphila]|uniref:energy-coupling factor transporter transmembrane component T family protein n=1 Tax=Rugosimonospora acidiphila TaxID=556531 RepID=UPI0031E5F0ED